MRYAHVFDGPGPDGAPAISPEHRRLDPAVAARVTGYLRSASVVVDAPGSTTDLVKPHRQVGLSIFTDGEWYWDEGLIRYVGEYLLSPNAPFVEHITARDFEPTAPTRAQLDELLTQLGLPT